MSYNVKPKLNSILKERGMTQVELAQLTGIQQGTLSRFDKNSQHLDSHLVVISRVLGLKIDDLFDIDEQMEFPIEVDYTQPGSGIYKTLPIKTNNEGTLDLEKLFEIIDSANKQIAATSSKKQD